MKMRKNEQYSGGACFPVGDYKSKRIPNVNIDHFSEIVIGFFGVASYCCGKKVRHIRSLNLHLLEHQRHD
jgi:hypothetical protein